MEEIIGLSSSLFEGLTSKCGSLPKLLVHWCFIHCSMLALLICSSLVHHWFTVGSLVAHYWYTAVLLVVQKWLISGTQMVH